MANLSLIQGTTFKSDVCDVVFQRGTIMTVSEELAEMLMKTGRFELLPEPEPEVAALDEQGAPMTDKIMVVDLTLGEQDHVEAHAHLHAPVDEV